MYTPGAFIDPYSDRISCHYSNGRTSGSKRETVPYGRGKGCGRNALKALIALQDED
jgi:hypothetical protein